MLGVFLLFVFPKAIDAAGVPTIIGYQGRLTDSSGNLLGGSGTTYYFKFSLWNSATVGGGARLWPSSAPAATTATVRSGVFTVNIGDTTNGYPDELNYAFDSSAIYLQVEVSANGSSYETLSPRQQISAAAFAQLAGRVSGTGQSAIGTTSPASNVVLTLEATSTNSVPLLVRGIASQSANLIDVWNASGTSLFSVANSGLATLTNLLLAGSTTLQNFSFLNSTGLHATTTSFFSATASSTNIFTSNLSIGSLSGILKATAGTVATALVNLASDVTGILPVANGGTGWGNVAAGALLYGNGSSSLATTTTGTAGNVLALLGGVPTWTASSTLATITGVLSAEKGGTGATSVNANQLLIGNTSGTAWTQVATSSLGVALSDTTGTLGVERGGSGVASFGQGWIFSSGGTGTLSASTSPTVNYLTATSTSATSTFAAGISTTRLNTTATSTLAGIVSQSIIPSADNTYDLGSATNRFRDLYLSTASLHLESTASETGSAKQWKFGIDTGDGLQTGTSTGFFRIQEGSAPMFYLNHAGQAGIGVTDPRARLHIRANSWLSGISNGTISSSGTTVTGVGTNFLYGYNKINVGDQILANSQIRTVTAVTSNTTLAIDSAFSPSLTNSTFQFQQPIARFDNNTGDTKLIVGPGGNVGIGDLNPSGLLSVGAGDAFFINPQGTVASGTWNGQKITPQFGGTGLSGFVPGDIIYANSPNSFAKVASSTGGKVLQLDFTTGAPSWVATSSLGISAGSSGLTSLGGQTGSSQSFATSSDTNIGLVITSSSNVHTFAPSWIGTLAAARGGTGLNSVTANQLLVGNSAGTGWTQVATSSLGLLTTNVAEGSNQYFTNARVQSYLDSIGKGYFFATSSVDYWKTVNNFFATSSADYWKTQNNFFSTTSANVWLGTKSTSDLAEGSNLYFTNNRVASVLAGTSTTALAEGSNLYFTSARVDSRINATSTIGTLVSAPSLGTVATSLTGFLKATSGVLSTGLVNLVSDVTGILPVTSGGTGWANIAAGAIPYGNGSNALATTTTGTNGQVLALLSGVPTWTATTTFNAPLSYSNGSVSLSTAGDWTGTLDGQEGSYYLANSFATSSANYWKTQNNFFATSSADFWKTQNNFFATSSSDAWLATKSTSNLSEGSNLYFTNNRVAGVLAGTTTDAISEGASRLYFTNSRVASVIAGTTTDAIAEGGTNQYFTNNRVGSYISGSSTVPHIGGGSFGNVLSWTGSAWGSRATSTLGINTDNLVEGVSNLFWTNNRFDTRLSASSTLPSITTLANLATVGTITSGTYSSAVSSATINATPIGASSPSTAVFTNSTTTNATSTNLYLSSTIGGAGLSTCSNAGDKLLWNATTRQFECGTDAGTGGGITSLKGQYSSAQTGGAQTFATSTDANIALTITSSGDTHTFAPSWTGTLAAARGGTGLSSVIANQLLVGNSAGTGWTQVATSSLGLLTTNVAEGSNLYFTTNRFAGALAGTTTDALAEGSTNLYFTNTRARSALSSTYPIQYNSGTGIFSLAFGTTTSNTWAGTQTFGNTTATNATTTSLYIGNLSGLLKGTSGQVATAIAGTDYESPLTFSYPLSRSANTISLAFGTTTNNSWSGSNTFNGNSTLSNATSTTLNTTVLGIGGTNYFTSLTGSGLTNTGGALTLDRSGDWTGTFDGQEGSYYLANSFATSSANYWKTVNNFFATSSSDYWLTQKTTDNLSEGSTNLYFTNARVASYISSSSTVPHIAGSAFGDILYWTGSAWSRTGTSSLGIALSDTTGTLGVSRGGTGATTLTGLVKGNGASAFTAAVAGTDYVAPGTTITTTYPVLGGGDLSANRTLSLAFGTTTSNTWAGTQTFGNTTATNATTTSLYIGNLSGLLKGTSGLVASAVAGTDYENPLTFNTGLTRSVNTVTLDLTRANTWTGLQQFQANASTTQFSAYGNLYIGSSATSTFQGNALGTSTLQGFLNVAGTNSTSTFSGAVTSQYLNVTGTSATSTFARGIDLAGGCFSINGACVGGGGGAVSSVSAGNASLTISPTTGAVVASLNLANPNTWTGLQQFSNASSSRLSVYDTAYFGGTATSSFSSTGALTLASALTATSGGTGQNTVSTGDILYGSGANAWGKLSAGTNGFVLGLSNGLPAWVATTTLSTISGTLSNVKGGTGIDSSALSGIAVINSGTWSASSTLAVNSGGTGASAFGQGWIYSAGGTGALSASTSPTVNYLTATSTAATSTIAGGLSINGGGLKVATLNCSGGTSLLQTDVSGNLVCGTDDTGGGGGSLQGAYDGGALIETAAATPFVITETAGAANSHDLLQLSPNPATGGTYSGDALQITMDAVDVNAFTGSGLRMVIDQSQVTGQPVLIEDDAGVDLLAIAESGALTVGSSGARADITVYGDLIKKGLIDKAAIVNVRSVFIYDTTRDSDTGAWVDSPMVSTHSWYTEAKDDSIGDPCNPTSDDRCGASKFPKKAVLIAADDAAYIFDALDGSMWMKFTQGGTFALGADTNNNPSSVFALNGVVYVGTNGASGTGLYAFDFYKDRMYNYDAVDRTQGDKDIANRNTAVAYATNPITALAIGNALVNDVHGATMFGSSITLTNGGPLNGGTFIAVATDASASVINLASGKTLDYADGAATDDVNQVWVTRRGRLYLTNETLVQIERYDDIETASADDLTPNDIWDEQAANLPNAFKTAPTLSTSADAMWVIERDTYAESTADTAKADVIYVGHSQGLTEIHDVNVPSATVIGWSKFYDTNRNTGYMSGTPRGYFAFNETTGDLIDSTIRNSVLEAEVAPTYGVNGVRGTGLSFNGTSQFLCSDANNDATCDTDADFNVGLLSFHVELWFKHGTTLSGTDTLVNRRYATLGGAIAAGYSIEMNATGNIVFGIKDDATAGYDDSVTSTQSYADNEWHHLVAVNTDTALCLYVDGKLAVACDTALAATLTIDASQILTIGADGSTAVGGNFWEGQIDDVYFAAAGGTTDSSLTQAQVRRKYLEGRQALARPSARVTDATTVSATTIGDSGEAWIPNEFVGSIVEITGNTGVGQTRRVVSNTGTVLTVSPAWTVTPDTTSDFEVVPEQLFGASNTVNAVASPETTFLGQTRTLYVGTSDGADGGGVTVFKGYGNGFVDDVYHTDAAKSDDTAATWSGTDADDITAIGAINGTIVFGSLAHSWIERVEKSLEQSVDLIANNINSIAAELRVDGLLGTSPENGFLGGADLAEYYTSNDALEAGEVASLEGGALHMVRKSSTAYDRNVIGVVATTPGIVLGMYERNSYPIALVGRVPVKVTTENGIIKAGDRVAASEIPGYGMRATKAGRVLGTALESMAPEMLTFCPNDPEGVTKKRCGLVTVFVNLVDFGGLSLSVLMDEQKNTVLPGVSFDPTAVSHETQTRVDETCDALALTSASTTPIDGGCETAEEHATSTVPKTAVATTTALISDRENDIVAFLKEYQASQESSLDSEIFTDRVSAGLEIFSPRIVAEGLRVDTITALGARIAINAEVVFFGRPYFTNDSAGFAVIETGERTVRVTFEKEYLEQPIVNATISIDAASSSEQTAAVAEALFADGIRFVILDKSTSGFTILVNKPVAHDVQFSWTAFAVEEARTHRSDRIEGPAKESQVESEQPALENTTDALTDTLLDEAGDTKISGTSDTDTVEPTQQGAETYDQSLDGSSESPPGNPGVDEITDQKTETIPEVVTLEGNSVDTSMAGEKAEETVIAPPVLPEPESLLPPAEASTAE